jgi:Bacterial cellulose synthase subunit
LASLLFATVFLVTALLPGTVGAQAAPASIASVRSVSALHGQSEQFLTVSLVPGLRPRSVTGTISVTGAPQGTVRVSAQGRVLLEAPASSTVALDAPLTAADISGQQVVLGLHYVPSPAAACGDPSSVATLADVNIATEGNERPPTTVAEFLAPAVPAILLPVPETPSDDVSAGIMAVSAAMAHRYPDARIQPVPDTEFAARVPGMPAGSRVIRVVPDAGNVITTVTVAEGRPTLTLAGHEDQLRSAALALASDTAALADDSAVSNMSMSLPAAPGLEHSLEALGAADVKLSGYGTQEMYLGISQSHFGGPISSWSLNLKGTHTAIPPGGQAAVSVYWNDYVLSSRTLESDRFEIQADVPAGKIQARNGLRLRLTALPPGGNCSGIGALPMELTLDTSGSKVIGVRGHSVPPGFERFPQVLGNRLPVAYDAGAPSQVNTLNAALLVASLQRHSAELLDVYKVDAASFTGSSDSGLFVGATADTANKVSAPLRLAEFRTVNAGSLQYGVGADAPFGVLEAFEHNGRNILMLGAWAPDADPSASHTRQRSLAAFVNEQDGGWTALSRNLLLTQAEGEPVMLDSNSVVPQPEVTDSYRPYGLLVGVVIALLGLAWLSRIWWIRRHRNQARSFAEATERAAADGHDRN